MATLQDLTNRNMFIDDFINELNKLNYNDILEYVESIDSYKKERKDKSQLYQETFYYILTNIKNKEALKELNKVNCNYIRYCIKKNKYIQL